MNSLFLGCNSWEDYIRDIQETYKSQTSSSLLAQRAKWNKNFLTNWFIMTRALSIFWNLFVISCLCAFRNRSLGMYEIFERLLRLLKLAKYAGSLVFVVATIGHIDYKTKTIYAWVELMSHRSQFALRLFKLVYWEFRSISVRIRAIHIQIAFDFAMHGVKSCDINTCKVNWLSPHPRQRIQCISQSRLRNELSKISDLRTNYICLTFDSLGLNPHPLALALFRFQRGLVGGLQRQFNFVFEYNAMHASFRYYGSTVRNEFI